MPIINGKRVEIPDSGVYGEDLQRESGNKPGRRTIIKEQGTSFKAIDPNKKYYPNDLKDKRGNPVKIVNIPDRTKGSFEGHRSQLSKQIITEQVYNIAEHLFKDGVDFDEDNADWMVVPNFRLPSIWHSIAKTTPLLILFPKEYPELPPIGFYMRASIPKSPHGHLYQSAYHEASKKPLDKGWQWYCVYIQQGNWQPASVRRTNDWLRGDNLWEYFSLIDEALASRD
jgi:hypothetical protein